MQLQCGIFDSVGLLGICLHECGNYLRTFAAAPVCGSLTAVLARSFMDVFGGAGRDRTADKGFADLCLTTWRPRLGCGPFARPRKRCCWRVGDREPVKFRGKPILPESCPGIAVPPTLGDAGIPA